MEAKQGCKARTCDAPNAFTQMKLDDTKEKIILALCGPAAEAESLCETAPVHKPFLEKERGQII